MIEIDPGKSDASCLLSDVAICSEGTYVRWYILRYGFRALLSILLIVTGIMMLFVNFTARHLIARRSEYVSLALFNLAIGIWSLMESQVPMLLAPQLGHFWLLNQYLGISLIPFFFYIFSVTTLSWRSHLLDLFEAGATVATLLIMDIQVRYFGQPRHLCMSLVFLLFLIEYFGIMFSLYKNHKYHKFHDPIVKPVPSMYMSISLFQAAALIEGCRYLYNHYSVTDAAVFLRCGAAIMTAIILFHYMNLVSENARIAGRSEILQKLAYTDTLTGCYSRNAYEMDIRNIQKKMADEQDYNLMIISFDINNLKYVNDHFGHAAGDKHIEATAAILKDAFKDTGKLYRIGGDEFSLLYDGNDMKQKYDAALTLIRAREEEYNKDSSHVFPLHIAIGYAITSEMPDHSWHTAATKADALMYLNKVELKTKDPVRAN